jgi:hypothetical protein
MPAGSPCLIARNSSEFAGYSHQLSVATPERRRSSNNAREFAREFDTRQRQRDRDWR